MPTTYEGWLDLVKQADTLGPFELCTFLEQKGIKPPTTLLTASFGRIHGCVISEHQQAYAQILCEHFLTKPITAEQWETWLNACDKVFNLNTIDRAIYAKTGERLFEGIKALAEYLGSLKLTLKEGESL